jgi:membrane associated rhomboid family serine protease
MIIEEFKKQFSQNGNSVMKLLWINGLVFFTIRLVAVLLELFYLPKFAGVGKLFLTEYITLSDKPMEVLLHPWTLVTTIFTHWDFLHLAGNMLMLYFVGQMFSREFGERRLMGLYIIAGIGANLFYLFVQNTFDYYKLETDTLLGASGAVISLLIALATVFPNREISLFFAFRIKLVWLAVVTVALFTISVTGGNGGGEVCHLGGALMGFIFGKLYQNGIDITKPITKIIDFIADLFKPKPKIKVSHSNYRTAKHTSYDKVSESEEITQQRIDEILDKLKISGYPSLTKEEKAVLFEYSNK